MKKYTSLFNKINPLSSSLIKYYKGSYNNHSIYPTLSHLKYSTQKEQKISTNNDNLEDNDEYEEVYMTEEELRAYEKELRKQQKTRYIPQKELAETMIITLDDKTDQLSSHIEKCGKWNMCIIAVIGTHLVGNGGWYAFQLMELPIEMEKCMTTLPVSLCIINWIVSTYFLNNKMKEMNWLEYIPSRRRFKLFDIRNDIRKDNFIKLTQFSKMILTTKYMHYIGLSLSMCAVASVSILNPYNDPLLAASDIYDHISYSLYPIIPYFFTMLMHYALFNNVENLKWKVLEAIDAGEQTDQNLKY